MRSSATAEDLPDASFAGQQDTFLNVTGEDALLEACKRCYASLFTDRAIAYRDEQGFDHLEVALSAGVQTMVRSDQASAGVMFTVDTETGFPHTVVINAAWGLGESVVQGSVTPDQYTVFKPFLRETKGAGDGRERVPILGKDLGAKREKTVYAEGSNGAGDPIETVETSEEERRSWVLEDEEILRLARWAMAIEDHYGRPMDVEWAKDGRSGELYIVQARPETVQSNQETQSLRTYTLEEEGEELVRGLAIGAAIAAGAVQVIESAADVDRFEEGSVLVTSMTDPDWVPIMKQAAGIVTDRGGRTSHAAIVSRELGIPAVVGTGRATEVTLSCVEGQPRRREARPPLRRARGLGAVDDPPPDRDRSRGRPVGICGQAPSDHPDFAEFLVECGIDSISLNPDSVLRAIRHVAAAEARRAKGEKDETAEPTRPAAAAE